MFVYGGNHRGQVVFRAAVGQRNGPDGFSSVPGRDPYNYYLAMGVVETDPGALPVEQRVPFVLGSRRGAYEASMSQPLPGLSDRYDDAPGHDLGNVLSEMQVPAPGGFANFLAHGALFMRRTRFPGPEGRETLAFSGILRAGPDLPERFMFAMEGSGATLRLDPKAPGSRPAPETFPVGSAPTQTLAMPIWGFGPEPRGIRSTLHLDTIDEMKELTALRALDKPDAGQEARIAQLVRSEGGHVLRGGFKDERFQRWREIARELGHPIDMPPDSYLTADEKSRIEASAAEAARLLVAEEDARYGLSPRR